MKEDAKSKPQAGDSLIGGAVISIVLAFLALFIDGIGEPSFMFGLAAVLAIAGAVRRIKHKDRGAE